jgi:hypothetical protein
MKTDPAAGIEGRSKLYAVYLALFVTCLLASNVVAVKLIVLGPIVLTAAVFLFPVTYIFGDVLTEVYGYEGSRRIIWLGMGANVVMVLAFLMAIVLPPASFWDGQAALVRILGQVPRIVIASMIGYWAGEFANSFVLAKLKVLMQRWDPAGRFLFVRTISSTVVGEGVDSLLFVVAAFLFTMPLSAVFAMVLWQWVFKVAVEVVMTPVTYLVVNATKRVEGLDVVGARSWSPMKWG